MDWDDIVIWENPSNQIQRFLSSNLEEGSERKKENQVSE